MRILRQMGDIRIPTSSFILFVELCCHFWEPKYDHSFWATTLGKNTLLVTIKALMDSDTYKYVLCDQAGSVGLPLMISKEVTEERIFCLYVSWRVIVVKWFDNKCFNYHSNGSGTVPLSTIKLWNNKVLHKDCQAIAIYIYWPIISH